MSFEFSERNPPDPGNAVPSVLIVEDDPSICKLIERHVTQCGFDALLVSSIQDARQAMCALVFPIVVLDASMGEAASNELIAELRVSYAHHRIYIVLLSELGGDVGSKAGADAHLSKAAFPAAFPDELHKGMEVARLTKR